MMTRKTFLNLTRKEIVHIRNITTPEEKSRLNTEELNPDHVDKGIYGLMTGGAFTDRSMKIMPKKYGFAWRYQIPDLELYVKIPDGESYCRFTPLELFLYVSDYEMHESIIAYIKGDIDTFRLRYHNIFKHFIGAKLPRRSSEM